MRIRIAVLGLVLSPYLGLQVILVSYVLGGIIRQVVRSGSHGGEYVDVGPLG
jgi:hypothetical protein